MIKERKLTPVEAKIVADVKRRWAGQKAKAARKTPAAASATATGASSPQNGAHSNGKRAKIKGSSLPGARLTKANRDKESAGRLKAAVPEITAGALLQLDPKTCRRSPWNRDHFDPERMAKMTANVKKEGVLQNGIVRRNPGTAVTFGDGKWIVRSKGGGMLIRLFDSEQAALDFSDELNAAEWEIIAGERRWSAALATGRVFPAVERQANDIEALELQLAENSDREDLNALDEARKFEQLRAAYVGEGSSKMEAMKKLQDRTGLSESAIYERLKLLELPEQVATALEKGELSASAAGLITGLKTPEAQAKLASDILKPREVWFNGRREEQAPSFREAKQMAEEACAEEKRELAWQRLTDKYTDKGYRALTIAQSAKVFRYGHLNSGYVSAGDKCEHDPKGRSWKTLLEDCAGAPSAMVVRDDYKGTVRIVFPRKGAEKALFAGPYGFTKEAEAKKEDPEAKRQREQEKAARQREARFLKNAEIVARIVAAAEVREPNAEVWRFLIECSGHNYREALLRRRGIETSDSYQVQEKALRAFIANADGKTLRGVMVEMRVWAWQFHIEGSNLKAAASALGVKLGKDKKSQASGDEESEAAGAGEEEA